jgi:hypothetical protein
MINEATLALFAGLMGLALLYQSFQLWLARRDADILRQVPVVRPTPADSGSGCLGTVLLVIAVIVVILVARVLA